jgi:hypothetical protein
MCWERELKWHSDSTWHTQGPQIPDFGAIPFSLPSNTLHKAVRTTGEKDQWRCHLRGTYGGLSHFLCRKRAPVPHVRLHMLQVPHGLQSPSTCSGMGVLLTHSPARHHWNTAGRARTRALSRAAHSPKGRKSLGDTKNQCLKFTKEQAVFRICTFARSSNAPYLLTQHLDPSGVCILPQNSTWNCTPMIFSKSSAKRINLWGLWREQGLLANFD